MMVDRQGRGKCIQEFMRLRYTHIARFWIKVGGYECAKTRGTRYPSVWNLHGGV